MCRFASEIELCHDESIGVAAGTMVALIEHQELNFLESQEPVTENEEQFLAEHDHNI